MPHPAVPDHAYTRAIDHLYALGQELAPPPPLPDGTPAPRRKWDLAHMRTLSAALAQNGVAPQSTFPSVLIAGTNGKGSTAATLASILAAAGYKTGLYTSPHLTRVNERIQILPARNILPAAVAPLSSFREAGGPAFPSTATGPGIPDPEIPDPTFARLYFQVDDTATRLIREGTLPHHPSFFETLTAVAFLYFAEEHVDIAILEVGLGGRLDATNIVEPLLSVITDIALDHQEYLGNTIAEITREKAGILRANGTLITLPQHPEANQAIGEAAALLNLHAISAADLIPSQLPPVSSLGPSTNPVILSEVPRNASTRETQSSPCHPSPKAEDLLLPLPVCSQPTENSVILSEVPRNASSREMQYPPCHPSPKAEDLLLPLPVRSQPDENPVILSEVPRNASSRGTQSKDPEESQPTSTAQTFQAQNPTVLPRNHYTLTLNDEPLEVDSPLSGHHQQRNLALAIATANALRNPKSYKLKTSNQISYNITNSAIEEGIRNTSWPGRLEFLPPNLLLDVAHNPAGAWTLRAAIARLPEDQPRTLLFSCLADKDLTEISRILFPLFDSTADRPGARGPRERDHIILAPIANPRAARVEDLLAAALALDIPAHAAPHLAAALAQARAITPPGGLILATGSVYLVGAIRDLALQEQEQN